MNLPELMNAVEQSAAIRRVKRLQPAGGPGDKIFPPTYPGQTENDPPRHVFERRHVNGEEVWSVLVDSVQSQTNRMEEALLAAASEGLSLPYVTVDFTGQGLEPLCQITSLDAPHRVYDAILRDSLLGEDPFMESEQGRRLAEANPTNARALLELSPNALLFGAWHSQGEGGGLGAKFARVIVSEIMGINTPVDTAKDKDTEEITKVETLGKRTAIRMDPLGISKHTKVFKRGRSGSDWDTVPGEGRSEVKPSKILHGNIPTSMQSLGVTCAYVEHRAVVTLAGIRKLYFGGNNRNMAGRAVVAALGLVALAEQDARGYALRSRCDLVCEGAAPLELVHADGSSDMIELDREKSRKLYEDAYENAEKVGFKFESLTLTPQRKLIDIIQDSRNRALEGASGEEESNG